MSRHIPVSPDHPTAFVLNIATAGLSAVRSLGRAGIPTVGIDPDPSHVGFASRYCTPLVAPHPVNEPEALTDFLVNIGTSLGKPGILSPASDATVLYISRFREQLEPWFRFIVPSSDVMEAAIDKRKLYDLCDRIGIDYADTRYPNSMDDVHALKDDIAYPAFIKPHFSHLWQAHFPGNKGFKVFNADELVEKYEQILPTGVEAMVQSIIQGPVTNIRSVRVYIDQHGELQAALTNRKIRQFPYEFGRATLAETIHDPELMEKGLAFFKAIDYRGFGLIEFKEDDRDGVLKATDLNPRWLKSNNVGVGAGIDFPLMHYMDLAGTPMQPQFDFKVGMKWLEGIGDIASSYWLWRHGRITPLEWLASYKGVQAHATFATDDIKPYLKEIGYGSKLIRMPLNMWKQR